MRRKYSDCIRKDGNCSVCSLVNYYMDCKNNPISNLEWYIRASEMSLKELSEKSGVAVRLIQNVILGSSTASNMSSKNLLALADALHVDPHELIEKTRED